jgi:hypothetical protein
LILPISSKYFEWLIHRPDNGGITHLCNVGILQRDYRALYPTKLSSSVAGQFNE